MRAKREFIIHQLETKIPITEVYHLIYDFLIDNQKLLHFILRLKELDPNLFHTICDHYSLSPEETDSLISRLSKFNDDLFIFNS